MAKHTVTLIPGDGIGPELTTAMRRVVEATGVDIEWEIAEAGADVIDKFGTPLPAETLDSIRKNKVAIKGPITTPVGTGFRSVNVAIRKELDLYACLRPAFSIAGSGARYDDIDLVIVRENTEDLYAGIEFEQGSEGAGRPHQVRGRSRRRHHPPRFGPLAQADLGHRNAAHRGVRVRLRDRQRSQEGHGGAQGQHPQDVRRPVPQGRP